MIITVKQVEANFENVFEVLDGNEVVYYAKAPWMSVSIPFQMENVRKLKMTDKDGNQIFTTDYRIFDNAVEQAIPMKYLVTGEQLFCKYDIIGAKGKEGSFYSKKNGFFDEKFCMEYNGNIFLGYTISKGKFCAVSIYNGEQQIAQITKPLVTINNLDTYYLHIADEYDAMLPLLSFFTVYYDYLKFGNSGEMVKKSTSVSRSWTFSKTNSYYNPDWIASQFGQEAADALNEAVETHGKEAFKKVKWWKK